MLNKREADRVARYIGRLSGIEVKGMRVHRVRGGASYDLECVDTVTGAPFIVRSMEDIEERNFVALED